MGECRSKYLAIKTSLEAIPDPEQLVDFIRTPKTQGGLGQPEAAICWANHPAESGGHPHTHYIVRFPSQVYWYPVRQWCKDHGDEHYYADVGRSWTRAVRYLLHLDNPEKDPIPRECFHYKGLDVSEIEVLLGAPRQSLLNDIRSAHCPKAPFGFVDWLCNERGHSPGEVCAMIRCILAASEYVARRAELEALQNDLEDDSAASLLGAVSAIPGGMPECGDKEPAEDLFSGLGGFGVPEGWA